MGDGTSSTSTADRFPARAGSGCSRAHRFNCLACTPTHLPLPPCRLLQQQALLPAMDPALLLLPLLPGADGSPPLQAAPSGMGVGEFSALLMSDDSLAGLLTAPLAEADASLAGQMAHPVAAPAAGTEAGGAPVAGEVHVAGTGWEAEGAPPLALPHQQEQQQQQAEGGGVDVAAPGGGGDVGQMDLDDVEPAQPPQPPPQLEPLPHQQQQLPAADPGRGPPGQQHPPLDGQQLPAAAEAQEAGQEQQAEQQQGSPAAGLGTAAAAAAHPSTPGAAAPSEAGHKAPQE